MKFIREIISGKQDGAGNARPSPDAGDALDLKAYSLPDDATNDQKPETQAEVSRLLAEGSWRPRTEGVELTRRIATAILEPSEEAAPVRTQDAPPPARHAPAVADDEPDVTGLDPVARGPQPAAHEPDREARRDEAPEPSGTASVSQTPWPGADADALRPGGHDIDRAVAEPGPEDREPPALHEERPDNAPADPEPETAPAADLPEMRDDPFNRIDRDAGKAAAQDAPSPFQRVPDRAPRTFPQTPRPRTRLADDLSMPVPDAIEVPAPAAGRAARRAGRVKTRLLGFGTAEVQNNPFDTAAAAPSGGPTLYPVGWLVIVSGPGRGHSFALSAGVSQIGRGEDQAVRLDFGDTSISRSNHAAVAYDKEQQKFYLGHGGKANLVRLDGKPVLSTEELPSGGVIQIGETKLQFVALCGAGFDWDKNQDEDIDTAIFG